MKAENCGQFSRLRKSNDSKDKNGEMGMNQVQDGFELPGFYSLSSLPFRRWEKE
jgi:hypothetical protein